MFPARASLLMLSTLGAVVACAPRPAPVDTSADVAAIKAAQDHEIAAVASGDMDSTLAVYTADVVMMAPDQPALTGADALRTFMTAMAKDFTVSGRYTSSDVQVAGDWGISRYVGELTMTPKAAGGKPVTEAIKGIHIFQRQPDGSWKIAQDVWNMDAPASAPPAAPTKR